MTDDQTPTCHCADLDLTDRQRAHTLGLEARIKELRTLLEEAKPGPDRKSLAQVRRQAYTEGLEAGRSNTLLALRRSAVDLRTLADAIDEAQPPCGLCGVSRAYGVMEVNGQRYCHGDDDPSPTCYERAQSGGPA